MAGVKPGTPLCTMVSTATAIRLAGVRNFATAMDLCKALGLSYEARTLGEILQVLGKIGAAAKRIPFSKNAKAALQGIENYATANPKLALLVDLRWGGNAHTLAVKYNPLTKCVCWYDPSGAFANTLAGIEKQLAHVPMMKGLAGATLNDAIQIERGVIIYAQQFYKVVAERLVSINSSRPILAIIGLEILDALFERPRPRPAPGPPPPGWRG